MRVRLRGWFRTITLVPWDEVDSPGGEPGWVEPGLTRAELRRLIAEEPGVAAALRAMLHDLGDLDELGGAAELAERVLVAVERGRLRVESRPYAPIASDSVELFDAPEWDTEPVEIYEDDHHWVEVELLDEADQPVAGERCRIVLPDGRERFERTNRDGLIRLDRVTEGLCTISFVDLDAGALDPLTRITQQGAQALGTGSKVRPKHWVEVELLGEDGVGIVGERCEITLPDGEVLTRKTDARGLIRLPSVAEAGECKFSFVDLDAGVWLDEVPGMLPGPRRTGALQVATSTADSGASSHWVEVELLDESGAGLAGAVCEITLPDGQTVRRKTDAAGVIRLPRVATAGDCQISFVDIDAGAWAAAE